MLCPHAVAVLVQSHFHHSGNEGDLHRKSTNVIVILQAYDILRGGTVTQGNICLCHLLTSKKTLNVPFSFSNPWQNFRLMFPKSAQYIYLLIFCFSYPSHPLIAEFQINLCQMWVSGLIQDVFYSLHVPNLLQASCAISLTLPVSPTLPKSVASATLIHMLFLLLYRSLIKWLNKTRPAPPSGANDKGAGGPNSLRASPGTASMYCHATTLC